MTSRQRFLNACRQLPVDGTPLWLMRQAGRALPEYRVLRERYSFKQLVQTPDLAAEVTLQPIRRFGFDGAVIFSDILVVAEALGQAYEFRDTGGIQMAFPVESAAEVDRLNLDGFEARLDYLTQSLRAVRRELADRTAVIGFAGSPWTLANFMIEGGSHREFSRARLLHYQEPALFERFMEKLTEAVIRCLRLQIEAGADVVQIFDSLAGLLPQDDFDSASRRWIARVVEELGGCVPVIVFCRGVQQGWEAIRQTGADVLGVDWKIRLTQVLASVSRPVGVQGNLDPLLLESTPALVERETRRILESMRPHRGHVFNLGHGVSPSAKLENLERLVHTVREFK